MLLGIPEEDQEAIRDRIDDGMRLDEHGNRPDERPARVRCPRRQRLRGLHRVAGRAPLRRPHDRAAQRRVRGRDRHARGSSPARRSSPTSGCWLPPATRPRPGSSGGPARCSPRHPDQRRRARRRPEPDPQRHRGAAALRVTVAGPGPLRHRRRRALRPDRPGRQRHGRCSPRRPTATSAASRTPTASTSTARSATTSPSATASTSASARRWPASKGRVALDEVLKRFPTWEVDWDNAVQAHTSTVRGWEKPARPHQGGVEETRQWARLMKRAMSAIVRGMAGRSG